MRVPSHPTYLLRMVRGRLKKLATSSHTAAGMLVCGTRVTDSAHAGEARSWSFEGPSIAFRLVQLIRALINQNS